jgi:hypothetical protein
MASLGGGVETSAVPEDGRMAQRSDPIPEQSNVLKRWWASTSSELARKAEWDLLSKYVTLPFVIKSARIQLETLGEQFLRTIIVGPADATGGVAGGSGDGNCGAAGTEAAAAAAAATVAAATDIPIKGAKNGTPLVFLHGFGAALGLFYRNYDQLAQISKTGQVVGVDWLGMGLSSRADFPSPSSLTSLLASPASETEAAEQAVSFFTDALEAWREEQGIEQFDLMGHRRDAPPLTKLRAVPAHSAPARTNCSGLALRPTASEDTCARATH